MIISLIHRLRALIRRRELDADLEAELAHHLAMKQRAFEQEGDSQGEPAARQAFGSQLLWKEETRSL